MKTFTVGIDERMDHTLEALKVAFGMTSKADVFRMGVALLNIASAALKEGNKMAVANQSDQVVKEIVIPTASLPSLPAKATAPESAKADSR
jgi:hypothetical protein